MSSWTLEILGWIKLVFEISKEFLTYHIRDEIYYKYIKGEAFYFKECTKHVTICKNGHGIIINSCIIRVLNDEKFQKFERGIDISDAKKDVYFKRLKQLCRVSPCDRFNEMGFWYNCDTNGSYKLISGVKQLPTENRKKLKIEFDIDKRVLKQENKKIFNLTYAISNSWNVPN